MTNIDAMIALLKESRREHYHCEDSWYCCGKCRHPDHGLDEGEYLYTIRGHNSRESGICNCGADKWNTEIDEVLS